MLLFQMAVYKKILDRMRRNFIYLLTLHVVPTPTKSFVSAANFSDLPCDMTYNTLHIIHVYLYILHNIT